MNTVIQLVDKKRICKTCDKEKLIGEFKFHKGNKAYLHTCEACFVKNERKRQKKLWIENPEYAASHNAKGQAHRKKTNWKDKRTLKDRVHYRYGVSWDYVLQTLASQYGRCANVGCSKEVSFEVNRTDKSRAVIDHCHATGKFRAILCGGCNTLLGILESKSDKILGLMDYMNKHRNNN